MHSIRTYDGPIHLCSDCGQPCHPSDETGPAHFREQWDGIHCIHFPLAGTPVPIRWDPMSLQSVRQRYPDTYPRHVFPAV